MTEQNSLDFRARLLAHLSASLKAKWGTGTEAYESVKTCKKRLILERPRYLIRTERLAIGIECDNEKPTCSPHVTGKKESNGTCDLSDLLDYIRSGESVSTKALRGEL